MSDKPQEDWLVGVIEKYCCNQVTQYQITTTNGKPEERTFDSGCHIKTGKLVEAIRAEIKRRLPPKMFLDISDEVDSTKHLEALKNREYSKGYNRYRSEVEGRLLTKGE